MIFSMTGFSAAVLELETGSLSVEMRSVNHRYLDIQLRVPDEYRILEQNIRELITASVSRGKVECRANFTARTSKIASSHINMSMLQQLARWNTEIRNIMPTTNELSVSDILHWKGIFENETPATDKTNESFLQLIQQAVLEFNASRAREGDKLKGYLLQHVEQINSIRAEVAPRIPAAIKAFETKLRIRLLEAIGVQDDERLNQEISLFANKIDVDEELSRLHTHLTEINRVLEKGGNVGKRLDFLLQELHREANTLGAKSVDAAVSRASIEIKVLIEQMREQIQNLE
jgi:uncharacterized protein (TIGR00255 family)